MRHFFDRGSVKPLCFVFFAAVAIFFAITPSAHAAPLTWTTSTTVALTSPATNLTIGNGSVGDIFTINATSVVVTMSNSTGGNFTLLSPSYDLAVATSTGGGTVTNTCSSGVVTVTLSQTSGSTAYTITPTTQNCSTASAPIITNITTSGITTNSATVTWTTNVAADSTVFYGTTTSYGATSTNATTVTSHSITLSGLATATQYHFAVKSSENGTSTTSGDNTFTTSAASQNNSAVVTNGGTSFAAPSFLIDGGASVTALRLVTLSFFAPPGISSFMITGHGSTITVPYASTMSWDLCGASSTTCPAGTYTISIQFLQPSGNVVATASESVSYNPAGTSPTVANSTSSSTGSSTTLLAQLEAELQSLLQQAGTSTTSTSQPTVSNNFVFTQNLELYDVNTNVTALQQFLIQANSGPAAQALARHGASETFGLLTYKALIEFQKSVGIVPASGYFGPKTRAYINTH